MVKDLLGDRIDLHAGGEDLVFPHHENEIAQSEAALAKPLANYWMHNGFVKIRGDKMSKSLKNFTTIRSLLETTDPMVVRLFVLQAHYRSPIDFTDDAIAAAENGWRTLKEALLFGHDFGVQLVWIPVPGAIQTTASAWAQDFQAAMDDDFNTSEALAVLFAIAKILQRERNLLTHEGKTETDSDHLESLWRELIDLAQVLGLEAQPDAEPKPSSGIRASEIEALIQQRQDARKAKNFAEADRIRNELQTKGITLVDQAGGETRWYRS
jgi:cysteinyl-tRNA synthetase